MLQYFTWYQASKQALVSLGEGPCMPTNLIFYVQEHVQHHTLFVYVVEDTDFTYYEINSFTVITQIVWQLLDV